MRGRGPGRVHTAVMDSASCYVVPMSTLDGVPVERQLQEQDVHLDREYVSPQELDRARLLSIADAGRLRVR